MSETLYSTLEEARNSLNKIYDKAWDMITEKETLTDSMRFYLNAALESFETIQSCKYAPCSQCAYYDEDDTPFCTQGHNFKWKYADQAKKLLK